MLIRNKYLGISNRDVEKETNLSVLKKWLVDIEENITCMELAINGVKLKAFQQGLYADVEWFNKINTAYRLQKLLKIQIEDRIFELNINNNNLFLEFLRSKLGLSLDQWNKLKEEFDVSTSTSTSINIKSH